MPPRLPLWRLSSSKTEMCEAKRLNHLRLTYLQESLAEGRNGVAKRSGPGWAGTGGKPGSPQPAQTHGSLRTSLGITPSKERRAAGPRPVACPVLQTEPFHHALAQDHNGTITWYASLHSRIKLHVAVQESRGLASAGKSGSPFLVRSSTALMGRITQSSAKKFLGEM
ncbi:hypothetical protein MHYP_G00046750 [Metynnis hypsauchen]